MRSTISSSANNCALVATLLISLASSTLAQCQSGFTMCQPSGATATTIPSTGAELAPLYNDLLGSVQGLSFKRSEQDELTHENALLVRDAPSICCNEGTSCLNLQGFNVPMCYDRFTTNFKLINGASGTIDSGTFTGADGGSANLRTGTFSAGGSTGNMYSGVGASNSPTNSAMIPVPFTGTGVGSAIPLTALGLVQTLAVTVPATTVAATTLPGTTLPGVTQDGTTVTPQTAPSTLPGTTRAGTTAAGSTQAERTQAATTIEAHTTLITTTIQSAAAAATSASSTGAAVRRGAEAAAGAGLAGVLAVAILL